MGIEPTSQDPETVVPLGIYGHQPLHDARFCTTGAESPLITAAFGLLLSLDYSTTGKEASQSLRRPLFCRAKSMDLNRYVPLAPHFVQY